MTLADNLQSELDGLEQQGRRRRLRTVQSPAGRTVALDGRTIINFSSNNYLGLANHPALIEAATCGFRSAGAGATASRLIIGNHAVHETLEHALAGFHGFPSALLFNSGYNANIGVLPTLTRAQDTIFSDALNHASIIDGCRLSRARVVVYPHRDVNALRDLMATDSGDRQFVVTDTIFSMDGDRAPLAELAQLCRESGAALVIDEAHAVGVFGPGGRGLAASQNIEPDALIGTLGKSFGCFGAYVTGRRELIDILMNRARSFVFTTALPPGVVAANTAALELIRGDEGERRRALMGTRIDRFRQGLHTLSLLHPGAGHTSIFPVMVGDDVRVMECTEYLLTRGIYAQGIRPPTVQPSTARLRFALIATHTDDDIEQALDGLKNLIRLGLLSTRNGQR